MRALLTLGLLLAALCPAGVAQPITFGSADDPTEAALDPLGRMARLAAFAGPSYIGVNWRAGIGVEAEGTVGPFSVWVDGRLRAGFDGVYEPDIDEPYDAVRLLRYARLSPTARLPIYLRFGPLARTTLGEGLLVQSLGTYAAWEERTVGIEMAFRSAAVDVEAFSGDVRPNNLVGGAVTLRPFGRARQPGRRSLSVHAEAVHDLGLDQNVGTTAIAAGARSDIAVLGDFSVTPYASHARYLNYGSATAIGAAIGSPDIVGVGRANASIGLIFSSEAFIPGFFGAFYSVHNPDAGIVSSDAYFRDRATEQRVGTRLADAPAGTALTFNLQALVFDAFELSQYIRRDFDGATGAYALRLIVSPARGRDVRFHFELHRQGVEGLRTLFSDLVDEAILVFALDYSVSPPLRLFIRSRYGYTPAGTFADGSDRFLIERRFEPMVGVSFRR